MPANLKERKQPSFPSVMLSPTCKEYCDLLTLPPSLYIAGGGGGRKNLNPSKTQKKRFF